MDYRKYLDAVTNAESLKELMNIRNIILYEDNDLDKGEMFLLGEFIEFRKDYLK